MTDTLTEVGFSQEAFESFLEARNEPSWLTERRRQAWSRFMEMDWPARNEEEWIRTDIRLFKLDKYGLPTGEQTATADDAPPALLATGVELGGYATSFDGRSVAVAVAVAVGRGLRASFIGTRSGHVNRQDSVARNSF